MSEEKLAFQAEVSRLLQMMVNSVYSDKEVFLRELISNASDACDKLRYESLNLPELLGDDPDFAIDLAVDKDARTLTIADNGIGMSREDMIADLGTIARSGTSAFVDSMSGDSAQDMQLIGQFGVGFYSAFMVAKEVEVISRRAGSDEAHRWHSEGTGEFTVAEAERAGRGSTVILHLKEGEDEWLEPHTLQTTVRKYSDHIALPIRLATEADGEAEAINTASAIWARPKSEITEEQYKEFYHHVGHAFDEPWLTIHYKAEGKVEYSGLLFVPTQRPYDLFDPARQHRVKLYVKRIFITDEAEGLVPGYLRFVRGVVDSEDLPLNISREMLQNSPLMAHMRQAVTRRVLTELKKKAEKKADEYATFWENFGPVVKEGLYEDAERREELLALTRFRSTTEEGWVSFADYVGRMQENQTAIYYITGDDIEAMKASPQLEGYRARGIEVLLLGDPVDDFWLSAIMDFDGKPLKSATQGASDLADIKPAEDDAEAAKEEGGEEARDAEVATLIALLKQSLGEAVKDVRSTDRLTDSPVCLIADEGDMDLRLERMMKAHNRLEEGATRILEINPKHALIRNLIARAAETGAADALDDAAHLLLDQARIVEGEAVADPAAFTRRMSEMMSKATAG